MLVYEEAQEFIQASYRWAMWITSHIKLLFARGVPDQALSGTLPKASVAEVVRVVGLPASAVVTRGHIGYDNVEHSLVLAKDEFDGKARLVAELQRWVANEQSDYELDRDCVLAEGGLCPDLACSPFVVFVFSRETAETLAQFLTRQLGVDIPHMHSGLSAGTRREQVEKLSVGSVYGLVATAVLKAGVNIPRIRFVAVWEATCLSDVFQSWGRGGRDGSSRARCLLFWWPGKPPVGLSDQPALYSLAADRSAAEREIFSWQGLHTFVQEVIGEHGQKGLCIRQKRLAIVGAESTRCNAGSLGTACCSSCRGDHVDMDVRVAPHAGDRCVVDEAIGDDEAEVRSSVGSCLATPDEDAYARLSAHFGRGRAGVPCPVCGLELAACQRSRSDWNQGPGPCSELARSLGIALQQFKAAACFHCLGLSCPTGCQAVGGARCKRLLGDAAFTACYKCLLPGCRQVRERFASSAWRWQEHDCLLQRDLVQPIMAIVGHNDAAKDLFVEAFQVPREVAEGPFCDLWLWACRARPGHVMPRYLDVTLWWLDQGFKKWRGLGSVRAQSHCADRHVRVRVARVHKSDFH